MKITIFASFFAIFLIYQVNDTEGRRIARLQPIRTMTRAIDFTTSKARRSMRIRSTTSGPRTIINQHTTTLRRQTSTGSGRRTTTTSRRTSNASLRSSVSIQATPTTTATTTSPPSNASSSYHLSEYNPKTEPTNLQVKILPC